MTNPIVLLVDDDPSLLQLHQFTLKAKNDCDVYLAASGQAAFEKIKVVSPDIVILDLMMPDIDGIEVCRYMRTQPGLSRTPIVILTGLTDASAHARARQAGATAIWLKPLAPSELAARIGQLLNHAHP